MTTTRLFVDTNVFLYAVGGDHPMKEPCGRVLKRVADRDITAVINAEVIQEILYRYHAIRQLSHGIVVARESMRSATVVLPVTRADVERAMLLLESHANIQTRDAIHAATMIHNGIEGIISVDKHFDLLREIKRIDPAHLASA
jgi:predicted nucleic acid-binding protein